MQKSLNNKYHFLNCFSDNTELIIFYPTKLIVFFVIILFCCRLSFSQTTYPQDYFSAPLDIALELSGSYGELRNNHFHSGLDFRTQEVEGLNVYAVADAYVSRIKVSAYGFGNALYLTHPNGYVSVYAHLQKFNKIITRYLRKKQYQKESFEIDLSLKPNEIRIKKGDTIALSGNSGSSEGPHLHFEIREQKKEIPINPLYFGFKIKDTISPVINSIYCKDELNGLYKFYEVEKQDNDYFVSVKDTLLFPSEFSLGISCFDFNSKNLSKNGIYSLSLYFDTICYQKLCFSKFSFDESRFVNALIDYKLLIENNLKYIQSKLLPGNKLNLYDSIYNNGVIKINDDIPHLITYIISDYEGNTTKLCFPVKRVISEEKYYQPQNQDSSYFISYASTDTFTKDDIKLIFSSNSLYENLFLNLNSYKTENANHLLSNIFEIHYPNVPIHKSVKLSIKADSVADSLKSKLLIVNIKNNNKYSSVGGNFNEGFVTTNINYFGKFAVSIDTIAPVIKPLNISQKTLDKRQKSLDFRITDELSGISTYRATLNGKWILMEFDSKNNLLTYVIDEKLQTGSNQLILNVLDKKQNSTELEILINK